MASDVYLHVGAPKTGTSYLQLSLWKNEEQVRREGVTLLLESRRRQFDAVADMRGGMWTPTDPKATWRDLVIASRDTPGTALVSEELLCATPEQQAAEVVESLSPARVHIVLTARDIGRQIPAEWQQAVRARSAQTYEDWLVSLRDDRDRPFWNVQDPVRVLQRWAEHVSPEQFHLITVPPRGADPETLWRRFSGVVGLPSSGLDNPPGSQNPSLGLHEAEVLRRVNAALGDKFPMREPYISIVRDHLMRPVLYERHATKGIGVPAEHIGWIVERSREIAETVECSGINVVGDANDLAVEGLREGRTPGDVATDELLDVSVEVIVGMLSHLDRDMLPRIKRMRRRIRKLNATKPLS